MFNPLELYCGLPYYGFVVDPSDPAKKRLILSPICSERMPVPEFMIPFLGKERRPRSEKKKKKQAAEKKRDRPASASGADPVPQEKQVRLTKTGQLVNTDLPPLPGVKREMTQAERIQKYGSTGNNKEKSLKKRAKTDITFHAAKTHSQQIKEAMK